MGHGQGGLPYILDDPEGNPRVMKSARLIFDRNQKYEDLERLGSRLKPAAGWKFRTVVRIGKLPVNAQIGGTTRRPGR